MHFSMSLHAYLLIFVWTVTMMIEVALLVASLERQFPFIPHFLSERRRCLDRLEPSVCALFPYPVLRSPYVDLHSATHETHLKGHDV